MLFLNKKRMFVLFTVFFLYANAFAENQPDYRGIYKNALYGNPGEQSKALQILKKDHPKELIDLIIKDVLEADKDFSENRAFNVLKNYPEKMQVPALVRILENSESFMFKKALIEYMGRVKGRSLVIPLSRELASPFRTVRVASAIALKNIGDDRMYPLILNLASSENPVDRIHSLEAMSHLYDVRFYSFLVDMLNDPNKSVRIRVLAAFYKNNIEGTLPLIRKTARTDPCADVRVNAIRIIGEFRDYKSKYVLVKLLSDPDGEVRLAAARILSGFNFKDSAYSIANRLNYEKSNEIKDILLGILLEMGKTGDIKAVINVLGSDNNFRARVRAAALIGKAEDKRGVQALIEALNDSDFRVRAEACASLGSFPAKNSIEALLGLIGKEKRRFVRSAALYALKEIDDKKSIEGLFDLYSVEKEPVFRDLVEQVLKYFLKKYL